MATGSVAEVTTLLASWCKRAGTDLALVEFDSELARERAVEDLRSRLLLTDTPFHELALSAKSGPPEVVRELISELDSFKAGVVSISGFGQIFPLSSSHEDMLATFNFQRERLAEPRVRQIWWLPARVAEIFLHGAPDLFSWFTVRLHLTEMIAPLIDRRPIESWIAKGSEATSTSLEDARQRSAELARRFEQALEDPEEPIATLAKELMEPAVRVLKEANAERDARQLERDLRQRARDKRRPLPPRIFISYSHDSCEHVDRVLELADRLRSEGVDAWLDQYEISPPQGWQLWMQDQIEVADFVLVIATEIYERRRRGREEKGKGLGARFEGTILSQALYDRALYNETFIPVLFSREDQTHIPIFLRSVTHYIVDTEEGYEALYRRLTNQPQVQKPQLGQLRRLAPKTRLQRFASGPSWNVPYGCNPYFTGREEELAILRQALHRTGSAVISGLGGIGKTQTAVEYAYRHRADYQAVLWTRAETDAELAEGFSDFAAVLNLPERDAKDQNQAVQAVKRWLDSNRFWLLVFDSADVPRLVAPYLPTDPKGHVLLTSRAQLFDMLGIRKPLRLGTWSQDESLIFLLERTERQHANVEEREAGCVLAKELGHLPLALEQAGAFMAEKQAHFVDYLGSFETRRLRLLEQAGPRATAYPESVATVWALNFEQVEAVSTASAEILRLSAFLSPDWIPMEILTLGSSELGPTLAPALGGTADDPLVLDEVLEPLSRYSLIEREPETRSFSVHRMVQEVLRAALDEEDQRRWAERAVRALSLAFPSPEVPSWPLCERLLSQATAALEMVERYGLELEPAADLFNRAGVYSWDRGRYRQAQPFLERSLGIREEVLGPEHPRVAMSLGNLALLYSDQGDYVQAESLSKRSLKILEKVLGSEHPSVATGLNNLAKLYQHQGNYSSAAPLYERSLGIWEKVLGLEHPNVAKSLNNLAYLRHEQGDFASAARLYGRSLAIQEKLLGSEHPDVATSLNNLANLIHEQGDDARAATLHKRSLAIREKVLGPEHPEVATSLNNLAILRREQGDYPAAAELYERSLAIRENFLGPEHPDVAASLNNLGRLHFARRDYASAVKLYKHSLAIFEKALGPANPRVAEVLQNYARLLEETGQVEKAEELETRAKAIRNARSGQGQSLARE